MKAIAGILKYFLLFNPVSMIVLTSSLGILAFVILIYVKNSQNGWMAFLFIGVMQAAAIGFHLRSVVRCSGTELLPHHRKYHLITVGGIFTIMFLLSTVTLSSAVILPWSIISLYLLFSALSLWLSYLAPINEGFQHSLLPLFFLMMMTVSKNKSDIYSVVQALSRFGSLYIIIISLLSLIFFCRYFLKGHYVIPNPSRWRDNLAAMAKGDLDLVDFGSRWITSRLISRLVRRKNVSFQLTRLLCIGLFSPSIRVSLLNLHTILVCLPIVLCLIYFGVKLSGQLALDTLPIICVLVTTILTFDFHKHRTKIPTLYLQSRLPSRRTFIDIVLRCYLSLIGKQLAFVVLAFALIITMQFGLRPDVWNHMLNELFLGLSMSLGLIAVFLIYYRRIQSMEIFWILFFALFIMLAMLTVVDNWYGYSIWIIVPMIIALCLFRYAVRHWSENEIEAFFDAL